VCATFYFPFYPYSKLVNSATAGVPLAADATFLSRKQQPCYVTKRKTEAFSFIDVLCKGTVACAIWLIIPCCLVKRLLSSLIFLDQNARELNTERASFETVYDLVVTVLCLNCFFNNDRIIPCSFYLRTGTNYFHSKLLFCGVGLTASHRSIIGCKVDMIVVMNAFCLKILFAMV
jgi:hypothetical protein